MLGKGLPGWAGCLVVIAALLLSAACAHATALQGYATPGGNPGVDDPIAMCPSADLTLIGKGSGLTCQNAKDLVYQGPYGTAAWTRYRSTALDGTVRLWAPYDMLWSYSAQHNRCAQSRYFSTEVQSLGGSGAEVFRQLVWNIQAVEAMGLTPEIEFSAGSGVGGVPRFPDPGYGEGSNWYSGVTDAGQDYFCGVQEIMRVLATAGVPVSQYESFNEPDHFTGQYGDQITNPCAPGTTLSPNPCGTDGQPAPSPDYDSFSTLCKNVQGVTTVHGCGQYEAAELWYIAQAAATLINPSPTVAVGPTQRAEDFGAPGGGTWGSVYALAINEIGVCLPTVPCGSQPTVWAIHDYDDATAGGTADLRAFETALVGAGSANQGPVDVWVTESGTYLRDQRTTDANDPKGLTCKSVDPTGPGSNTLGCHVDGNTGTQKLGAEAFEALSDVNAPDALGTADVVTTEVDWYEFKAIGAWDSALVDYDTGKQPGLPRAAFCVLTGSPFNCCGNPFSHISGADFGAGEITCTPAKLSTGSSNPFAVTSVPSALKERAARYAVLAPGPLVWPQLHPSGSPGEIAAEKLRIDADIVHLQHLGLLTGT